MHSRASPAVGLGAPGLARRGLGQARQATDHPIRAGRCRVWPKLSREATPSTLSQETWGGREQDRAAQYARGAACARASGVAPGVLDSPGGRRATWG